MIDLKMLKQVEV